MHQLLSRKAPKALAAGRTRTGGSNAPNPMRPELPGAWAGKGPGHGARDMAWDMGPGTWARDMRPGHGPGSSVPEMAQELEREIAAGRQMSAFAPLRRALGRLV